jgi:hypothetical protein
MPKIAATSESEAAPARPITSRHRAAAASRGLNVDGVVAALRQSLAEAHHALSAIVAAAPDGDDNLATFSLLGRQLLRFAETIDLLAPKPPRTHVLFDGRR